MQLFSVLFSFFIPVSALIADRIGRRKMLIYATTAIAFFGFLFFLNSGSQFW
jgi:MFS family permease